MLSSANWTVLLPAFLREMVLVNFASKQEVAVYQGDTEKLSHDVTASQVTRGYWTLARTHDLKNKIRENENK